MKTTNANGTVKIGGVTLDLAKISHARLLEESIEISFKNSPGGVLVFHQGKDNAALGEMDNGELIRMFGKTGYSAKTLNQPYGCVFVVQDVTSGGKNREDGWYENIQLSGTETVPTLNDALKSVSVFDLFWDGAGSVEFEDATGKQFDGNVNHDAYTYLVKRDGKLNTIIRCQYAGKRDELVNAVCKFQKQHDNEIMLPADFDELCIAINKNAKKFGYTVKSNW